MPIPNLFYGHQDGLTRGASPTTLAVGDSWFWYPFDNLLGEIATRRVLQSIVVAGYNGSEASEWQGKYAVSIKATFDFYARGPLVKALLLSGGGNDIVGQKNFPKLIKANCSACQSILSCYADDQPSSALDKIIGHYRRLIKLFRTYNQTAVVVLYNYDDAYATGDGVFGPADWLKVPMEKCQVPASLRKELFADLVAAFGKAQDALVAESGLGKIVALKTTGTLDEDQWANELHPTPEGFQRLAELKFLPALDAVWQ
jgi:hypothetical protein